MKRRKPLRRSKPLKSSGAPKGRAKGLKSSRNAPGYVKTGSGKSTKTRKAERKRQRFERHYHSVERVQFVNRRACVCGGLGHEWGCEPWMPRRNSHDPTKASGGTYEDIHPATDPCHALIDANDFWHRVGKTREEANAATHQAWLRYSEGLTE